MMIKERYKLFGIPISGNTITNFVFLLHKEIEKQILEIVRAQHEKDEVITALLLELLIIFSIYQLKTEMKS
jgi:hypothetical protein